MALKLAFQFFRYFFLRAGPQASCFCQALICKSALSMPLNSLIKVIHF